MLVLDEAAQLGELPQLRQAVTLLRGYGVRTWSFWQDISQLENLYPVDWRTIVNNCRVVQAFGMANLAAAETIRAISGFRTAIEILDLDADEMLLLAAGDEAVIAQRPNRGGSVCLNSSWASPKCIPTLVRPPSELMAAR